MKTSSRRMKTWHSLWPQKVTGSFEFSDLLYDHKGNSDLCGRFDVVYDPLRSRGHKRSPWFMIYFMTQKVTVTFVVG